MTGWKSRAHWQGFALAFALLALSLKVLAPPGYMVSGERGAGFPLVLCTAQGMVTLDATGQAPAGKGDSHKPGKGEPPCAFAGHGAIAEASAPSIVIPLAVVFSAARPIELQSIPGRGLAAPPPFSTGPPRQI